MKLLSLCRYWRYEYKETVLQQTDLTNFFEEVLPRGMSADIDFNDSLLEIVEILTETSNLLVFLIAW